jgi:hypothetical protein
MVKCPRCAQLFMFSNQGFTHRLITFRRRNTIFQALRQKFTLDRGKLFRQFQHFLKGYVSHD